MPVNRLLEIFILFTCITFGKDSLLVRTVQFEGNDSFTRDKLAGIISTRTNSVFSDSILLTDSDRILDFYKSSGYFQVQIDTVYVLPDTIGHGVDVYIRVFEGKPVVLRRVDIFGCVNLDPEELRTVMKLNEGSPFVASLLEKDIQAVLNAYDLKGFPLAKVAVRNITFTDSINGTYATIELNIDEGKELPISEVRVEGNMTTNESVIIREARLRKDQIFRADLPEIVKRRLDRMQLFSSVSMPELYLTGKGEAGLLVKLTEGKYNSFDGVLGYIPADSPNSEGYLMGLIDFSFRNLFGTGRKLSVRWFQENRFSRETELRYFEPWLASYPVNIQLGFIQRKQDSTFVREQYDISAVFMITEEFSVGATYAQADVYPSTGYGQRVMASSKTTSFGASVYYDSRDNPVTPLRGILYSTEYRSGTKRTAKSDNFPEELKNTTRLLLFDLSYYISLFYKQVFAAELHIRDFTSASMDLSDLFRLGGTTTLRGYREGQFLGSRLVWLNMEYRFIVAARSFFYGFVDIGYIENPDISSSVQSISRQNKIGYGIGVRMDSGIGLIGVSFAMGEGDTFGTSKIHIRLINEF